MKITELLKRNAKQPNGYSVLAAGTAVSFGGKLVGRGLNMALQLILARWLGPQLFGIYAIAWTLLRVLGLITPLGLDLAIIRFGAAFVEEEPAQFKGLVRQSWLFALLAGGIVSFALFLLAPWIANLYGEPALGSLLRWFAPAFLFLAGMRIVVSVTKVKQEMGYAVLIEELLWPGLNLLLVVALLRAGMGVTGSAVAIVLSLAVAFVLGSLWLLRLFPVLTDRQVTAVTDSKALLSYSIPAILAFATGIYLYWVDRLMIGLWRPTEDVGIYQAVGQFGFIFAIILASLNSVMMPMIATHLHNNQMAALGQLFRAATKWGLYLSLPLFLVIWLEAPLLIATIFGDAYVGGTTVLRILIGTQLINVSTGAVNHLLISAGYQRVWLRLSLLALLFNISLNVLLLPRFGLEGAAWATAVSITALVAAGIWQTKKRLHLWPYSWHYGKGILAAGVTLLGLYGWQQWVSLPAIPYLLLMFLFSGGLFVGILLLLGLDEEDKTLLSSLPFSI